MRGFILILILPFLSGCGGHKMTYGVVSKNGNVNYPLCERAKQRITDMKRMSFELPAIFKNAPCRNWPDYLLDLRFDAVHVELPGVIANESQMSIGGVLGLSVTGVGLREYYLPSNDFFVDYPARLQMAAVWKPKSADWVDWGGMRCARFYSENQNHIFLQRVLDYFCWESVSGYPYPFHINVGEKVPVGRPVVTNLDKELVEPVLASLRVNPANPQTLAKFNDNRARFCTSLKENYDSKGEQGKGIGDDLDRRRTIRYLRACGYRMPDPVGIADVKDIFKPSGQLIGRRGVDEAVRRVSAEQFVHLEATLKSLRPKLLDNRPETVIYKVTGTGSVMVPKHSFKGVYAGDWYALPPYNSKYGFGLRHDPVEGRVMDVYFSDLPWGMRIMIDD